MENIVNHDDIIATKEHAVRVNDKSEDYFDEMTGSLAGLVRQTKHSKYSRAEQYARDELTISVSALLEYHDTAIHKTAAPPEDDAPDPLFPLAPLTSKILWYWERACKKHGEESPFADLPVCNIEAYDLERNDVQMVVQTAKAAQEIINAGFPVGDSMKVARLIARQGPAFIAAWTRGDIIRKYCEENSLDANAWLSPLTAKDLYTVALDSSGNPLERYINIYRHLATTLSTANITRLLQLSEQEVDALFPPYVRKHLVLKFRDPTPRIIDMRDTLGGLLSDEQLSIRYGLAIQALSELMPLNLRVESMLRNPSDPLSFLDAYKYHVEQTLTVTNIANELGWTEDEVRHLFKPGHMRMIASDSQDPLRIIRRMAGNRAILNAEYLAQQLHRTPEEVDDIFSLTAKRFLTARSNPLDGARRVVAIADMLRQKYTLPAGIIRTLSGRGTMKSALKIADLIIREQANRPPGVSEDVWAHVVMMYPAADAGPRRREHVYKYHLLRGIMNPRSFDEISERIRLPEALKDSTCDPAEMLEAVLPSEALEKLAREAGISTNQLDALLSHFADNDDAPIEGALAQILVRLRSTAEP